MSREEIAALFLGSIHLENEGDQVVALDQRDEAIREFFYTHVARRSLIQVRAHWARMVFTGGGRPPKQLSMDELIQMLQSDPSAVTYLPLSKVDGLKILMMIQNGSSPDVTE